MFGFKFLGNTKIPHRKNTASLPAVRLTPPKEVLIPMTQHLGAPATPIVKFGDEVKVGQKIAEANGPVSAPIYASVSGKVAKPETYLTPGGKLVSAIRIVSDGQMTPVEVTPPTVTDFDSFVGAVRESGIVGLGGAGFPTAVKLAAAKDGKIDTVVINAAECEPYITSDTRRMIDCTDDIVMGVGLLFKHLPGLKNVIFGIESNKKEAIAALNAAFADNSDVSVTVLPSKYPQGAEKIIVHNTTRRVVPEGKLPADVGVIVMNVSSVAAIAAYVRTGMPLVERTVTVDGSAVRTPMNLTVPVGTPIRALIDFVGDVEDIGKVLYGGPMMGVAIRSLDEPVLKTTNAITVLTRADALKGESLACVHCGRCVAACPMGLNPTTFSKALEIESKEDKIARLEDNKINLCMECGCCSFVCPSRRPLVQNNRLAKGVVKEHRDHLKDKK